MVILVILIIWIDSSLGVGEAVDKGISFVGGNYIKYLEIVDTKIKRSTSPKLWTELNNWWIVDLVSTIGDDGEQKKWRLWLI